MSTPREALDAVDRMIRVGEPIRVAGEDLHAASCPRCRAIVWHCDTGQWECEPGRCWAGPGILFELDHVDSEPYLTIHDCQDPEGPDLEGFLGYDLDLPNLDESKE